METVKEHSPELMKLGTTSPLLYPYTKPGVQFTPTFTAKIPSLNNSL
jgi:hypothetical protein